jgi:phosphatidylglycerol phospholipase C
MDWCIRQGVDGIVTDNISKYFEVCETFNEERKSRWLSDMFLGFTSFNIWVFLFGIIFLRKYGTCIDTSVEVKKNK